MLSSRERALLAIEAAFTKNARQPVLLEVSELSSYTDYILILSGQSTKQVEAIGQAISQEMKGHGIEAMGAEGGRGSQWVLLDYSDVVIHIFYHPLREYYDLEGLWSEAQRVELQVPPELRVADLSS